MANVMIKKHSIIPQWKNAKNLIKEGKLEEVEPILWSLIGQLAKMTMDGIHGDELVEGVKLDLWKDRIWLMLQKNGFMK